jgi:hypothetical protein
MLNIDQVKKEYYRIATLLNKQALTGDNYNSNCQVGFSMFQIKKHLGLSWNNMKKIIGAKAATSANNKGQKISKNKILCNRDGTMISINNCVPGCNDACEDCDNKQIQNTMAINTTSAAEDRELNYTSSFGNSGALAASEGIYNN